MWGYQRKNDWYQDGGTKFFFTTSVLSTFLYTLRTDINNLTYPTINQKGIAYTSQDLSNNYYTTNLLHYKNNGSKAIIFSGLFKTIHIYPFHLLFSKIWFPISKWWREHARKWLVSMETKMKDIQKWRWSCD